MYNTKEWSGVYNSSEHDRIKESKDALAKFSLYNQKKRCQQNKEQRI